MASRRGSTPALVAICLLFFLSSASSQQGSSMRSATENKTKIPRVGLILPGSARPADFFRKGMADFGYVDGKTVTIEVRAAESKYDLFPELFAEMIGLKPDVLVVQGAVTARPAKKLVTTIPIVFAVIVDPVVEEVVSNMKHPGGNMTGVTTFDPQQSRKQLELLKEIIPGVARVAVLADRGVRDSTMNATDEAASGMGIKTQALWINPANPDFEGAFAEAARAKCDAMIVLEEPLLGLNAKKIAELAVKSRMPTLVPPSSGEAGGLVAYGVSIREGYRLAAGLVDKILKGANPGDTPVEIAKQYELIVNAKTAEAFGVTVPSEVLKRADRIIR